VENICSVKNNGEVIGIMTKADSEDDTKCSAAAAAVAIVPRRILHPSMLLIILKTSLMVTRKEDRKNDFYSIAFFLSTTQSHELILLRSDNCLHSPHPFQNGIAALYFVDPATRLSQPDKSRRCS
jgi:hypothetical protein